MIATDFFRSIFGQPSPSLPTVGINSLYDRSDLYALEEPFTWAEIASAIDKLPNNRSPGPDGYTNEFFKSFRNELKDDLLLFFNDFYNCRSDLQGVNTTNIVLIPKTDNPVDIKNFRPISLVHSLPKLTSKVLVVRFQRTIPSLVHPLQSGFLPGRSIVETSSLRQTWCSRLINVVYP